MQFQTSVGVKVTDSPVGGCKPRRRLFQNKPPSVRKAADGVMITDSPVGG